MNDLEPKFFGMYLGTVPVKPHRHDTVELVWQEEGCCRHWLGEQYFETAEGDLLIVPPDTMHRQESVGEAVTLFSQFAYPPGRLDPTARVESYAGDRFVGRWFSELIEVGNCGDRNWREMMRGLLHSLVSRIAAKEPESECGNPALRKAKRLLDAHFTEERSIASFARQCGLSHSHFSAMFRETYGITPVAYVNSRRLELARRLLCSPYPSLGEVASRCGFNDVNYFLRQFKRHFRCTPKEFIESLR